MKNREKHRYIGPTYFNELIPIVKSGGMRLFFHYHLLILKKLLGHKKFKINNSNVCTSNNIIRIGSEYQLREGSSLERVIIEKVWFKHFFLFIRVLLIDENKSIGCSHTMKPIGYSGIWRLWDKDHYDIKQWRKEQEEEEIDYDALDNIPVIEI